MTLSEHWNAIFSAGTDAELGWYESDVSQTLKFLDRIPPAVGATVFLPGAGTSMLVDELLANGYRLVLNDISDRALDKLKSRIGENDRVMLLHHDVSRPLPGDAPQAGLWIDRAVLHFLLKESDIRTYFDNLRAVLRPGGYALLAEFSTEGAGKCAGLEVHRYSAEELTRRMGEDFELVEHEHYTYTNPKGSPRPYIYALFRRSEG